MADKDLFQILREKTGREAEGEFDRRFWARFESEFGAASKVPWWSAYRIDLRWLVPVGASLALAIFLWKNEVSRRQVVAHGPEAREMIEQAGLLKDMDLFIGEADSEVPVDYSSLSDDEWSLLLKGT
jgi:hypothetical protein